MGAFKELTMWQALHGTVEKYPDNEALVYPEFGIRMTYAQFYQKCREVAKGLIALGIQKGDHVSLWATNVPEWYIFSFHWV